MYKPQGQNIKFDIWQTHFYNLINWMYAFWFTAKLALFSNYDNVVDVILNKYEIQ